MRLIDCCATPNDSRNKFQMNILKPSSHPLLPCLYNTPTHTPQPPLPPTLLFEFSTTLHSFISHVLFFNPTSKHPFPPRSLQVFIPFHLYSIPIEMVPGSIQPQYHHYIPHFILKTFTDNFSLRTPNYIANTSDVSLATAPPPVGRPKGSGGHKKKGKRTNRRRGEHQIKVYQVEDQTTALNDADRSYGVDYIYRDIAEDDCMRFEKLLSKMESTSSTFIRKIWTGEDLSLTRVQ